MVFVPNSINFYFRPVHKTTKKKTVTFVTFVLLSALNNSAQTGRIFVKYEDFWKICRENSDQSLTVIMGTLHEDLGAGMISMIVFR
jgi:hypothetical protein